MEKRYQVFVSSTFRALQDERRVVIEALLRMNCIPSGMELFPASDNQAWQLIKRVIDESDYYLLIIGGRYGSLSEDGIGFTEREYDYAIENKKPVVAFLHKDPLKITGDKIELKPSLRRKLEKFRQKVEDQHHCQYWTNGDQLSSQVYQGITELKRIKPSGGWVRDDKIDERAALTIAGLKQQIAEMDLKLSRNNARSLTSSHLSQGDAEVELIYQSLDDRTFRVKTTWNSILFSVGPKLFEPTTETGLYNRFVDNLKANSSIPGNSKITRDSFETIKLQFRALGYLRRKLNLWVLSRTGEIHLLQLRAIPKSPLPSASEVKVIK